MNERIIWGAARSQHPRDKGILPRAILARHLSISVRAWHTRTGRPEGQSAISANGAGFGWDFLAMYRPHVPVGPRFSEALQTLFSSRGGYRKILRNVFAKHRRRSSTLMSHLAMDRSILRSRIDSFPEVKSQPRIKLRRPPWLSRRWNSQRSLVGVASGLVVGESERLHLQTNPNFDVSLRPPFLALEASNAYTHSFRAFLYLLWSGACCRGR